MTLQLVRREVEGILTLRKNFSAISLRGVVVAGSGRLSDLGSSEQLQIEPLVHSDGWIIKTLVWLLCPFVALLYFSNLEGAFQQSLSSILETARLEREFLLVPREEFGGWGDHYIYRMVVGVISVGITAFICGGFVREKGAYAGFLGGLVISGIQGLPFLLPNASGAEYGTSFLTTSVLLALISPMIGVFAGSAGQNFSRSEERGFAGMPRVHILWLWVPAYHYGLILITPIANAIKVMILSADRGLTPIFSMLPVLIYAAPIVIGLNILSGNLMEGMWGWARQVTGVIVIIGGVLVIYAFQIWHYDL
jgi:hypothetical protein